MTSSVSRVRHEVVPCPVHLMPSWCLSHLGNAFKGTLSTSQPIETVVHATITLLIYLLSNIILCCFVLAFGAPAQWPFSHVRSKQSHPSSVQHGIKGETASMPGDERDKRRARWAHGTEVNIEVRQHV